MHQELRSDHTDAVPSNSKRPLSLPGSRSSMPHWEIRHSLAQAIVDTVREPLLVVDKDLRIIAGSRSFHLTFEASAKVIKGKSIFEVIDRQPDLPALRKLLDATLRQHAVVEGYEIVHEFPKLGRRVILINAREISSLEGDQPLILLAFEDVTGRQALKREMQDLVAYKEVLLEEMQHRIGNSLQIIASILMLKARNVASEEAKLHLRDVHGRVVSIAATQRHLQEAGWGKPVDANAYLETLCATLLGSMIDGDRPVKLTVKAESVVISHRDAINIGLIVTEAVINALKYAFLTGARSREISVGYQRFEAHWLLSIADNGVGMPSVSMTSAKTNETKSGLGTTIVNALAARLKARVETTSSATGTTLSIIGS